MTVLLLAGTGEAAQIAQGLAARKRDAVASVAREGRQDMPLPLPWIQGGFGGDDGFRRYLSEQRISAVIDATHPFAERVTRRTARICAERSLPYCLFWRPAWTEAPGDRWSFIDREEDAAAHIAPGAVVFLATGRQTLERFANLSQCQLICRQLDPPEAPFPFDNGRYLVGTPPFSVAQERALFAELSVDWLVVKNAGGAAPASKLSAARELGIRVAMINRPTPPDALRLRTVREVLDWVDAL